MATFTSGMGVGLGGVGTVINLIGEVGLDMDKKDSLIILDNDSEELIFERLADDLEMKTETKEIVFEKEED